MSDLPRPGDILLLVGEFFETPSGWTRGDGCLYRIADGTETTVTVDGRTFQCDSLPWVGPSH